MAKAIAGKELMKKKLTSTLYWMGKAVLFLLSYAMLAFLFALTLGLPNTMFSGILGWLLVLAGVLITADDDFIAALKKFVLNEK